MKYLSHLKNIFFIISTSLLILSGCSSKKNILRVAATPVPHTEMLEFIKPDLKAQGIDLVIITTNDYNMPNRALAEKEIDANFFQHLPFLELQINEFNFPIQSIGKIEIEPMGVYSKKIKSISDLKDLAVIAIPNDPSNEGRALLLLQAHGIIQLKDPNNFCATVLDISHNPKHLQFMEVDAALLSRSLQDVDAAAINTNYALSINLNPLRDALILENPNSPYVNIIAVRIGEENHPNIQALKIAMTSAKMREFILQKYQGAVIPAF